MSGVERYGLVRGHKALQDDDGEFVFHAEYEQLRRRAATQSEVIERLGRESYGWKRAATVQRKLLNRLLDSEPWELDNSMQARIEGHHEPTVEEVEEAYGPEPGKLYWMSVTPRKRRRLRAPNWWVKR